VRYTGTSNGQSLSGVSGGVAPLEVRYDAATQRYTLAVPGGAETALGTPTATNQLFDTFRSSDANGSNDVRMIKVGANSLAGTRFVGGGSWLRTSGPTTALLTQPQSFIFGVATPAADVPLTGSASFAVVLNAQQQSSSFSPFDYAGSGLFNADFGAGQFTVSGTTTARLGTIGTARAIRYGSFSGSGSISGTNRSLTGNIMLDFTGSGSNQILTGRFFGPGAAEVGAAFGNQTPVSDGFVVGTLIGRRGTTAPVVETLSSLIGAGSLPYPLISVRVDRSGQTMGLPPSVEFNGGLELNVAIDPSAQTFDFGGNFPVGPSDRVAAESDGRFTVYRREGNQGPVTTSIYNQGSSNTELPLDFVSLALFGGQTAVPFGFQSLQSFIPLAGRASFNGVFYGSAFSAGLADVYGLRGLATLSADFGAQTIGGSFTAAATFQGTTTDLGRFTLANGRIGQFNAPNPTARPGNVFTAGISGAPGTIGSLFGNFYGPAVDELGAVVQLVTPGPGVVLLGQGVIVAKRGVIDGTPAPPPPPAPTPPANASLDPLTQNDSFAASAQRASAVYPGNGTSPVSANDVPLNVRYDAATQSYTVTEGSDSTIFAPGDRVASNRLADIFRTTGSNGADTIQLTPTGTRSAVGARFVAGGIWSRDATAGGIRSLQMRSFVFGIPTLSADIPTTGAASFGVLLNGVTPIGQTGSTLPDLLQVNGSGLLSVNFATRMITGNGALYTRIPGFGGSAPSLSPSNFEYSGNFFSGRVRGNLIINGFTGGSGSANGSFFGPGAAEIGLSYSVTSGTPIRSGVGVITGTRGTTAPAFETLTGLLSDVLLQGVEAPLRIPAPGQTASVQPPSGLQNRLSFVGMGFDRFNFNGAFEPANAVPAESDARFITFRKTDSSGVSTVRVYRAGTGNTELPLSYASLALLDFLPATGGGRLSSTFSFGLPTDFASLPRTGTGSYSGVAYGSGFVPGPQNEVYALTGTTSLTFDWGASTFGGSIALSARNEGTGINEALSAIAFSNGVLNRDVSFFSSTLSGVSGTSGDLRGSFFGPLGQELGASFLLTTPISAGALQAQGAIVGKRN
jgi:hypothetical protein